MMRGSLIFQVSSFNPERAYRILLSVVYSCLSFSQLFLSVYIPIIPRSNLRFARGEELHDVRVRDDYVGIALQRIEVMLRKAFADFGRSEQCAGFLECGI